jgi:hypothetical protein
VLIHRSVRMVYLVSSDSVQIHFITVDTIIVVLSQGTDTGVLSNGLIQSKRKTSVSVSSMVSFCDMGSFQSLGLRYIF